MSFLVLFNSYSVGRYSLDGTNDAVYPNWPSASTHQIGFNAPILLLGFFGATTLNTEILATLPATEMLLMPGLAFFLIECL